jgi:hypothetical protein
MMNDRFYVLLTVCVVLIAVIALTILAILKYDTKKRTVYLDRLFKACLALVVMGVIAIFKLLVIPP